ncbi:MAG TPA: DUF429 domain-containing protein [Bacillales bacterium]|nr:DUF429 domain-containing protein [Bacillales bacterium]
MTDCEVYPAAWLLSEGLSDKFYKKNKEPREQIVQHLEKRIGFAAGLKASLVASDHVLDAALCCLAGVDFLDGKCCPPPPDSDERTLRKEGWIWVKQRL